MKLSRFATGVLFCVASGSSLFAAAPMREGNWQVTMKMEMEGVPFKMPPITTSQCVKKEDLQDPQKSLPKASKDGKCAISDYKVDGNTVTWKFACTDKQKMTGNGTMTYDGDSAYSGRMDVDAGGSKMHMDMSGKRLGDCK